MGISTKKISELERIEEVSENTNVMVEEGGRAKVIPSDKIGKNVLNAENIIKQEYLPTGYPYISKEYGLLMDNFDAIYTPAGFFINIDFEVFDGEEYKVMINGNTYIAEAEKRSDGYTYICCDGVFEIKVAGGMSHLEITDYYDAYATVSIYGSRVVRKTIDKQLLPEELEVIVIKAKVNDRFTSHDGLTAELMDKFTADIDISAVRNAIKNNHKVILFVEDTIGYVEYFELTGYLEDCLIFSNTSIVGYDANIKQIVYIIDDNRFFYGKNALIGIENGYVPQRNLPIGYPYVYRKEGTLLSADTTLTPNMYYASYKFGSIPRVIWGTEYTVIVNDVETKAYAFRNSEGVMYLGEESDPLVVFYDEGANGGYINTPDYPETCTASIYGQYYEYIPIDKCLLPESESDVFIIYGNDTTNGYTTSCTYKEIYEAHHAKKKLVLHSGPNSNTGKVFELIKFDGSNGFVFQRIAYEEGALVVGQVCVKSSGATLTTNTITVSSV